MILLEQGCINIWIDEVVPCLKDTETGEIKETVVFKIQSRAYLKEFQKSNGWHINWNELPRNVDVYALALKEDNSIRSFFLGKNFRLASEAFADILILTYHSFITAYNYNAHNSLSFDL